MQADTCIDCHTSFAALHGGEAPIRVMLVDDEQIVRAGLRMVFGLEPDLNVVGEAEDGVSALDMARRLAPDVVVMDVHMPVMDGIQATRELRSSMPASGVVILTLFDGELIRSNAMAAGASAYIAKSAAIQPLVDAVRLAAAGPGISRPPTVPRPAAS